MQVTTVGIDLAKNVFCLHGCDTNGKAARLKLRRGSNVAAVALANKNARVLWALLSRGQSYRPAPFPARVPQAGG